MKAPLNDLVDELPRSGPSAMWRHEPSKRATDMSDDEYPHRFVTLSNDGQVLNINLEGVHPDNVIGVLARESARRLRELTALKARRCDGCKHGDVNPKYSVDEIGVGCAKFPDYRMRPDHACNAWQAKELHHIAGDTQ